MCVLFEIVCALIVEREIGNLKNGDKSKNFKFLREHEDCSYESWTVLVKRGYIMRATSIHSLLTIEMVRLPFEHSQ